VSFLIGHKSWSLKSRIKWFLTTSGLQRRFLMLLTPQKDWLELRPLKRRLGITRGIHPKGITGDKWPRLPKTQTGRWFFYGLILGIMIGLLI
jgi:hypothetical protein